MKKATKLRRTTGMALSLVIVVLSFFPIVYVENGGTRNIIQIVTNERFEITLVSGFLLAAYMFTPIMALVVYTGYMRRREGVGRMVLATYVTLIGVLAPYGIGVYCSAMNILNTTFPTVWIFVRALCGFLETANRMSGEEFFEMILKRKKK